MTLTLTAQIQVGPAQQAGSLTVHPLLRVADPGLEYRSFAQAVAEGFVIRELEERASVNDLLVVNPLDVPVLLYDGEEVCGAQQDRTLDRTVLVPAGARITVPVSCVEAGRWDGLRHQEAFRPGAQAAYPALRALKNRQSSAAAAAGHDSRADQGAVWDEVATMSGRRGAASDTGAMGDVFRHEGAALDAIVESVPRNEHQVGAVALIDGQVAVVDHVSRTDVWAALHRPLVRGYALDALDRSRATIAVHRGSGPRTQVDLQSWLDDVLGCAFTPRAGVGAGTSIALDACDCAAAGLVHEDELIQLSVFPAFPPDPANTTRIRRPSRRR